MDLLVVHNPRAGTGTLSRAHIRHRLRDAGHDVHIVATDEPDWRRALSGAFDLVVAAGGDGTLAKVFVALAGAPTPVAVVPLGTANNIARTLGVPVDDPEAVLLGIRELGVATGSWFDVPALGSSSGTERFVESAGGGLFGDLLWVAEEEAERRAADPARLERGLRALRRVVEVAPSTPWAVDVDGQDRSGRFLGVEMTNIRSVGPAVPLAPAADPADGQLDVVLIGEEHREGLMTHLETLLDGGSPPSLGLPVHRARRVRLRPEAQVSLHRDDDHWSSTDTEALTVFIPRSRVKILPSPPDERHG